jgi:hypothetical protein
MAAKNDITGDTIQTRVGSPVFKDNHETIFGKKAIKDNSEYFARLAAETQARMQDNATAGNEYYDVLTTEDALMVFYKE